MKTPLISIVIPLYNRAELIKETLNSVLSQTYSNWEAIVVDDHSTDNGLMIVREYAERDSRVKFVKRYREPKGAPVCRNIGSSESKGDFLIFLDSDDLLSANCLDKRIKVIEADSSLDFSVFPMGFFNEIIGDRNDVWLYHDYHDYISGFLRRAQWAITSPIWRKNALQRLGGFDESLLSWQDWELHLKAIVNNYKFTVIEGEPDCYCRRGGGHTQINQHHTRLYHTKNRIRLFNKAYQLLKTEELLFDRNRKLLVDQILIACTSLHQQNEKKYALKMWRSLNERKSMPSLYFYYGWILIKASSPRILFDTRISFHVWIWIRKIIRKRMFALAM